MPNPAEPNTPPRRARRGRPLLSIEHKRRTNAERQRRFRIRRAAELRDLRQLRPAPVRLRDKTPPRPEASSPTSIVLDLQGLP